MELLSPAGTPQALRAAVAGGADAVYFGADNFNARINAGNFGREDILAAIDYCHKRGVLCHAVLNTLVSDREFEEALSLAEFFVSAGIDAFIVQDVGLGRALAKRTSVPIHGSTQMTVHSLEGVLALADMGYTRAVLSRELSREDISYIRNHAPEGFELEIFVHGALCMCYSGQCYMSSIIGGRSGNRGKCAQPCRLPYDGGYRLSLKDMCMVEHLDELRKLGVDSLKIEGRMKSPEYVYTVTKKYADAMRGMNISADDIRELEEVFSRGGFTDGYWTSTLGKGMFGTKTETPDREVKKVPEKEYKRLTLDLNATCISVGEDKVLKVVYTDSTGLSAEDDIPLQPAKNTPLSEESIIQSLTKLGDTVYTIGNVSAKVDDGLFAPVSALNNARRNCLTSLEMMRSVRSGGFLEIKEELPERIPVKGPTALRGFFLRPSSIPNNWDKLEMIQLPLTCLKTKAGKAAAEKYGQKLCFVLPSVYHDTEKTEISALITLAVEDYGIVDFCTGNIGQVKMLSDLRLTKYPNLRIHGDYGLNVYNSRSAAFYRQMGLSSMLLTFEAPMGQVRAMAEGDTGIIAYGRLPFMVTRNCAKKEHGKLEYLRDRKGKKFLLDCEYGCRNRLFNSDILWLADKKPENFPFLELYFTDEDKDTAAAVIESYLTGEGKIKEGYTRGRY